MQTTIQAATNQALSNVSQQKSQPLSETQVILKDKLSPSLLARFWLKMAEMFGHSWVSQYGAEPSGSAVDTWATALAGLTPEQVAEGLREVVLLGEDWPPSAPKFRRLCFSIPNIARVRFEVGPGRPEVSRFTRLVYEYLDVYVYRGADHKRADMMLNEAYALAQDHIMCGGDLPEPYVAPKAIEKEPETVLTMEQRHQNRLAGHKALDEMGRGFGHPPMAPYKSFEEFVAEEEAKTKATA